MLHDLENLSLDELKALQKDVGNAIAHFEKRKKTEALAAARQAAEKHGFSLDQLLGGKGAAKSAPKYANPADPSQTWTGRGRQPQWVKDAMAAGRSLDDMLI
jgi:DNA-binding protein H-NS